MDRPSQVRLHDGRLRSDDVDPGPEAGPAAHAAGVGSCSGPAVARALHPGLPLLAVQRADDHAEVLALPGGEALPTARPR